MDTNGNLTIAEKQNGAGTNQEKWVYTLNPRDQMTNQSVIPTKVGIQEVDRFPWIPAFAGMTMMRRYEYDGLNLLRVDQRVDTDGDGVIEAGETAWRHVEVNSHRPGALGALSPSPPALSHHGEREPVCASGQSTTPSSTTDYAYVYDPVGNLYLVLTDDGGEEYAFSQDAWGNELSIGSFQGTPWSSARTYGVSEHQTRKWIDPFTGLYFFHHRWFEGGLGRSEIPGSLSLRRPG